MESTEALQARQRLQLRPEDLAVEVRATPDAVIAWETGRIRVPKHVETHLRWRVASVERMDALEQSGLPECQWVHRFDAQPNPKGPEGRVRRVDELKAHITSCPTCVARDSYIAERFPPMPRPPLHGWLAIAVPIFDQISKLPSWAQPAATGAMLFAAYSLFRIVLFIPNIIRDPLRGSLLALGGLTLSASLGALLGLLYGQYRRVRNARTARAGT